MCFLRKCSSKDCLLVDYFPGYLKTMCVLSEIVVQIRFAKLFEILRSILLTHNWAELNRVAGVYPYFRSAAYMFPANGVCPD